ncbi:MAG: hypothetical protein LUF04_00185, partial [Bacteroides sp.]|nr:hypothetical protein [Bacteroides sp.]
LAFAACTSDEFETTQSGPVDLSGRKALGNIELTFNGDGANTRLEIGQGGIGFSMVDGVGACLVDQPSADFNNEKRDIIEWYNLTGYISSNYLYKTADAGKTWTTDARMVEGNYVFYAPHNEAHLVRSSIEAEFPNPQTIQLKDGAPDQYSAIQQLIDTKAPMYVGYKFLDSKSQTKNISVAMKPIYSYPKITLKNTFGTDEKVTSATKDLTIRRIILVNNASTFDQKTTLTIGTASAVASNEATGVVGNLFNYGDDAKKYGAWATSDRLFDCASSDILTVVEDNGTTGAITLDFATPYVLGKGKSISINAVVPAGEYTNFKIGIYTNEGYFEKTIESALNLIPGQMYPQEEYMENGELNQSVKGSNMTVEMTTAASAGSEIVSTTDELANLVKSGKGNLTVMPLNADVAYNAKVAEYMLQGGVQSITFTAPVTVDNATVIKKLVFQADVTVKGNVEFKNADINWGSNKVIVKKDATLKMSDFSATSNDGVISPEKGATVELVNKSAKVPAIDAKAEGLVKVNEDITFPAAAYAGDIEIAAGKTMTLRAAFESKGTITNKGTLAMGANALTNSGTFVNENMVKGAGTITNHGTFTNKNIVDATFANAGSYTSPTEYTVATLNVETGAIMNKAVSNTKFGDGSHDKLINVIEVAKGAYFNSNPSAIDKGTVQYTIDGNVTSDPTVPVVCNKLVINGNVVASGDADLDIKTVADIEINGDVNAIGQAVTFSGATNVAVSGKVYASGAGVTFTAATGLEFGSVEADEKVDLKAATALKLNGNVTLTGITEMAFTEGATVTIAKNSNLSGEGKMSFAAVSKIKVLADVTLTIAKSVITGADGQLVTFESPAATGTAGDNPGKVRGQVVNYGTIQWAAQKYDGSSETLGEGWWTGNAADDDANGSN